MKEILLAVVMLTASIQAIANTTYGSDSSTGYRWQTSTNGNSTFSSDSLGNRWETTTNGNTTYVNDSNGNRYQINSD